LTLHIVLHIHQKEINQLSLLDWLDESSIAETVIPFPGWVVVPVADDDVV
jgi:hypothetical protein